VLSQVSLVYNKLQKNIQEDPSIITQIHKELSRLVSDAYTQSMKSDEGYCFKFTLPITSVLNLFNTVKLDTKEVRKAFQIDWKFPDHAVMYNDSYYHILLLILYLGLQKKDEQMVNNSFLILFQKLWNGRKYAYFKYCDKRIMNYVVNHMVNQKHNVAKYDTPLALVKDYFIPTLLKKYAPEINKDIYRLRQLFMQSWSRLDQMFSFNSVIDARTGEKKAQGGLLPLYMKAKADGLYQSTPKVMKNDDDESDVDQFSTVHNRDEIVTSTTDFITMNMKPNYPSSFIDDVRRNTKVSAKIIEQLVVHVHNHNNYDILHDLITLILSRTNIEDKNDLKTPTFINNVKRTIISSKNNDDVRKLQKLLSILVERIFTDKMQLDFNKYGKAQQMQICNVILYCLIYNLQHYASK